MLINSDSENVAIGCRDLDVLHEVLPGEVFVPDRGELLGVGPDVLNGHTVRHGLDGNMSVVVLKEVLIRAIDEAGMDARGRLGHWGIDRFRCRDCRWCHDDDVDFLFVR